MSAQPTALLVLTGAFGTKLNVANTGAGVINDDGSTNSIGTLIGVAQTAHATTDFALIGSNAGKWLPGAGALIGMASAADSASNIRKAINNGTPIKQSDIAALIGSAAGIVGAGALLITGAGVVVPFMAVVGVGAGAYQLIATATGWTIDINGQPVSRPLTPAESQEIHSTLNHALQSGLISHPDLDTVAPAGLASPARVSANFFTATGAHSVEVKSGATLSDLWLTQLDAANGFASAREFYAAVLASNPAITDINSIQAGQSIHLPQKLADGSITYFYANGASVNHHAVSGAYHMLIPNGDGGQSIYRRSGDDASGYTLRQTSTDALGQVTYDFAGRQATRDGAVIQTGLSTVERDGAVTITRTDNTGDGVFDFVRSETELGNGASLVQETASADDWTRHNALFNRGQRYDLRDVGQALAGDDLIFFRRRMEPVRANCYSGSGR